MLGTCGISLKLMTPNRVIYAPHKTKVLESAAEHLQIQLKKTAAEANPFERSGFLTFNAHESFLAIAIISVTVEKIATEQTTEAETQTLLIFEA